MIKHKKVYMKAINTLKAFWFTIVSSMNIKKDNKISDYFLIVHILFQIRIIIEKQR